ncbi:hypothetical protein [Sphingobium estronivorans]|uniref:hypothetical protein n=1 Tax=Sphingobium estronivorans TaxID=1577690 RepID=UPI00123C01E6|nr:hypothetical protein [Sphingobium estronivorans]
MTGKRLYPPYDRLVEECGWSLKLNSHKPADFHIVLTKEELTIDFDASRDGVFKTIKADIYAFPADLIVDRLGLEVPPNVNVFEVIESNFELVRNSLLAPAFRGQVRETLAKSETETVNEAQPQDSITDALKLIANSLLPWRLK